MPVTHLRPMWDTTGNLAKAEKEARRLLDKARRQIKARGYREDMVTRLERDLDSYIIEIGGLEYHESGKLLDWFHKEACNL